MIAKGHNQDFYFCNKCKCNHHRNKGKIFQKHLSLEENKYLQEPLEFEIEFDKKNPMEIKEIKSYEIKNQEDEEY